MNDKDLHIFRILMQKIVERMQQSYPGINPSITEWKGQEIVDFQEELLIKVKAHISEKWFYNHIKSGNVNLPRIDILNLLSRYVGYANWDDFRFKNSTTNAVLDNVKGANRYFIYIPLAVVLILLLLFFLFKQFSMREYRFSFYDADSAEPVTNCVINVSVLRENESPVNYPCQADGSFILKTGKAEIRFAVESPYYHTDTIVRVLNKFNTYEAVKLRPDYYALMIKYFSGSMVADWQKRRDQLNSIIADNAMIYQVHNSKETLGVELYNKWEFINKLSLPSSGLRSIEIFDTRYQDDKICLIRFRQKEDVK